MPVVLTWGEEVGARLVEFAQPGVPAAPWFFLVPRGVCEAPQLWETQLLCVFSPSILCQLHQ